MIIKSKTATGGKMKTARLAGCVGELVAEVGTISGTSVVAATVVAATVVSGAVEAAGYLQKNLSFSFVVLVDLKASSKTVHNNNIESIALQRCLTDNSNN